MTTVLVVDDEPVILRHAESILFSAGYRVVAACGAAAAMSELLRMPEGPVVVVADVVMPGASGPSCVDQILAQVPDAGVVLMSEYGSEQMRRYSCERGFGFVEKPLAHGALVDAVEMLVGSALRPVRVSA
jgi:DNA-binding NtrC family response regulator